jgi:hypothetical protein
MLTGQNGYCFNLSTVDGLAVLKQTSCSPKAFVTKGLKTHLTIFKDFRKDITFATAAHFKSFINSLLNLI